MHRRALLSGLAVGATASLAGCGAGAPESAGPRDVYNPTGRATIRPLDEPLVRHGLTSESGQYLHARLFEPGDSLAVTDRPDAAGFAERIEGLSAGQFALLTNLRTAAARPAHWWPTTTAWTDERLEIQLDSERLESAEIEGAEAVGVALTVFEYEGERPGRTDVVFPSGATLRIDG